MDDIMAMKVTGEGSSFVEDLDSRLALIFVDDDFMDRFSQD